MGFREGFGQTTADDNQGHQRQHCHCGSHAKHRYGLSLHEKTNPPRAGKPAQSKRQVVSGLGLAKASITYFRDGGKKKLIGAQVSSLAPIIAVTRMATAQLWVTLLDFRVRWPLG